MFTAKEEERLLERFQDLLSEKPIDDISIEELAKEAKIPVKKIRDNFEDSTQIMAYIFDKGVQESTKLFMRIVSERAKPDVKIQRLVKGLLGKYETYFPLHKAVRFDAPHVNEAYLNKLLTSEQIERYRENTAILARLIAEGQSQRIFGPIEPLEAAYLLRGLISAAIGYWEYTKRKRSLASCAQSVMRIYLKGLYK